MVVIVKKMTGRRLLVMIGEGDTVEIRAESGEVWLEDTSNTNTEPHSSDDTDTVEVSGHWRDSTRDKHYDQ